MKPKDPVGEPNKFDKEFLAHMIPHHQLAVKMADAVLGKGSDPRVRALADIIRVNQRWEIKKLDQLLTGMSMSPVDERKLLSYLQKSLRPVMETLDTKNRELSSKKLNDTLKDAMQTSGYSKLAAPLKTKLAMTENYISLKEVYEGDTPEENELLWQYIGADDYENTLYKVIEVDPVALYKDPVNRRRLSRPSGESLKHINYLRRQVKKIAETGYLVVEDNEIIDGHHRVYAMAKEKIRRAKAVDLSQEKPVETKIAQRLLRLAATLV